MADSKKNKASTLAKESGYSRAATISKLGSYIGKYWYLILLSLVLSFVCVLLTLYLPVLTGQAVDLLVDAKKIDFGAFTKVLVTMAEVAGITALAQWICSLCNNRLTYRVTQDIRRDAFVKLQVLPLSYVDSNSQGAIINRMITDVEQVSDGLLMGFTQLFTGVLTIIGTLLFMLSKSLLITAVVVLVTPISLFVAAFIAKKTYTMFGVLSTTRGEQTAYVDEMLTNERVVQAFAKEEDVCERFNEINERLRVHSLRAIFFSSLTNPGTRFVNSLVYALVCVTGAYMVIRGQISVGNLTCFLSYANQYTKPFNEISGVVTELQNAFACAAKVFEMIDEKPEVEEPEGAIELTPKTVDGSVKLEHVSFAYTENQRLIEDLNLSVKPGQRIAIVGPTGCGKTTLINLLMRFYDVKDGAILVSGTDIRQITRHSLRSSYGMVLQDVWLRSGTILDNLRTGNEEATFEEVVEAAKKSHAHSFIKRLPNGYDTEINEDGGSLSQGQKQLLCITRAMLSNPEMLILDEATSSIDTRTEQRIQRTFDKMMEGRTSFVVAHRLSTIVNSDLILVMNEGHIEEQGSHEELLTKGGFYSRLYNSQFAVTGGANQ